MESHVHDFIDHTIIQQRYIDCFNKESILIPDDFDFSRNIFTYSPPIKSARKI